LGSNYQLSDIIEKLGIRHEQLKQHHVFWVCLTCALSDAVPIVLGIAPAAGAAGRSKLLPVLKTRTSSIEY
jgi:arginine exporter protein ArgO